MPVYLDYHATTPVDPRVVEAMLPYFSQRFGNPSSRNHAFGWEAAEAVDRARQQVAALIGAHHLEIVFTSGATESNNMAIRGIARARRDHGRHVVTVATEHPSVLETCHALAADAFETTVLPVGGDGLVDLDRLEAALTPRTVLVSVMAANNEIGVLQPLAAIGRMTRSRGIAFHCDASQAVGKVRFDVDEAGVDLLSLTAHKFYGPKGVGALYVRRKEPRIVLPPLVHGGGQERGLRSGTLNVAGIVGLGRACEVCGDEMPTEAPRLAGLRDLLLTELRARIEGLRVNGSLAHRLPHNLNVSLPGLDGEALVAAMGDVAVSSGAACATGQVEPSRVLTAIGLDADTARASLRFGLGRWTTPEEIRFAVERVAATAAQLGAERSRLAHADDTGG